MKPEILPRLICGREGKMITIIGILAGVAIIVGLIAAMGKMSEQGVDINDHFCCGSCSTCSSVQKGESCEHYDDLKNFHVDPADLKHAEEER